MKKKDIVEKLQELLELDIDIHEKCLYCDQQHPTHAGWCPIPKLKGLIDELKEADE